jgi:putative MFS transporter
LLALLIVPFADRFGRRRVLLVTIFGYTVATAATAFAADITSFVVLQFMARMFAIAEAVLATVVIVEEFSATNRGWGIGAAAALQACGAGFAALMFGFVEVLPYGWRALYLIGVIPLFFIGLWRRTLPETDRFERVSSARAGKVNPVWTGLVGAAREHPRSLLLLAATLFCFSLAGNSAGFFAPKYLQEVHGWSPSEIAVLLFFGGALAVAGNPLSGWLSDRMGRRPTGIVFSLGFALTGFGFYSLTGMVVPVLWIALLFFTMGTTVTLSAYSVELFPTSMRASASAMTNTVSVLGTIAGLVGVAVLFGYTGSNWSAVLVLGGFSLLVPIVLAAFFPETAGKPLEEIVQEHRT